MEVREFGQTGLRVSALGFGAGHIGGDEMSEDAAAALLNEALDAGITLIDTARGYGRSEERIGRHISHRRSEFVLSTKVGYGVEGVSDWTYDAVRRGIDRACSTLRSDVLDIVHLHSCPEETLRAGEVVRALVEARDAGQVRVAAYSGENEALAAALDLGVFSSIQCSVNLFDQRSLTSFIPSAAKGGLGVIGKRPLANAPWRYDERPRGAYAETYWLRWKQSGMELPEGLEWPEFVLRFAAYAPAVSTVIVGTSSGAHLREHVEFVERGRLTDDQVVVATDAFRRFGAHWTGQI